MAGHQCLSPELTEPEVEELVVQRVAGRSAVAEAVQRVADKLAEVLAVHMLVADMLAVEGQRLR